MYLKTFLNLPWSSIVDGVTALASAFVVLGAIRAISQWKREQLWRSKEWIRHFSESFKDTPGAQNAIMMLNDSGREVPLWSKAQPEDSYEVITWSDLEKAFTPPSFGVISQLPIHTAIRDSFYDFLGRIGSLHGLLVAELISKEDAHSALWRWIWIIGERDANKPHIRNLRLWMNEQNLRNAQEVFKIIGFPLTSTLEDDLIQFLKQKELHR